MSKQDFRQKVKSYSEPYDHNDWIRMKQLLDQDSSSPKKSAWHWWYFLPIFILSIISITFISASLTTEETNSPSDADLHFHQKGQLPVNQIEDKATEKRQQAQDTKLEGQSISPKEVQMANPPMAEVNKSVRNAETTTSNNSNSSMMAGEDRHVSIKEYAVQTEKEVLSPVVSPVLEISNTINKNVTSTSVSDVASTSSTITSSSVTTSDLQSNPLESQILSDLSDIGPRPFKALASAPVVPVLDKEYSTIDRPIRRNKMKSIFTANASLKFPKVDLADTEGQFQASPIWRPSVGAEVGYILKPLEKLALEAGVEAGLYQIKAGKKIIAGNNGGTPIELNVDITENLLFAGPYLKAHYLHSLNSKNKIDINLAYHYSLIKFKNIIQDQVTCNIQEDEIARRSECILYEGEVLYYSNDTQVAKSLGQLEIGTSLVHKIDKNNHITIGLGYRLGLNELLKSNYGLLYQSAKQESTGVINTHSNGLELKLGYWFG